MSQTIITAGDANSGLIQSAGNDGTLVLQTGPAGGKVSAASLDATGQVTLLKTPSISTAQSMVRLNTANGTGSTNTAIRRFTNVVTNQGSDITYTDSSTAGASFTINTSGVYALTYSDEFSTTVDMGLSLNSSQLTTTIKNITAADRLASITTGGANFDGSVTWAGYLAAGSVVRAHTSASTTTGTTPAVANFTITRIA